MPQYTPTERRILDALADGMPHAQTALVSILNDDMTDRNTLHQHLYNLRKKMEEVGMGVQCVRVKGQAHYRLTRLVIATSLTE